MTNPVPASARERLIVALDFASRTPALALVDRLADDVLWYKVGMELFYAEGPAIVAALRERGRSVFLDLKLHDIPNTMAGAYRSLAAHGVGLTTVHIPAGAAALRAVAEASASIGARGGEAPLLLGVTRLTSLPSPDPDHPWDDVVRLAGLGVESGLDGWIAPVEAAPVLRAALGAEPILVCPGVRLPEGERGDQVSVGTPEDAARGGADWIVVGRPITQASDPRAAAREFVSRLSTR
jgi:orotidine-5'-phosphate decarboxylase